MGMVTFTNSPCIYSAMNRFQLSGYAFVFTILLSLGIGNVWAQKPEVIAISKRRASTEETITLVGSGFGTNAANIVVNFGAVRGQVTSIANTLLEVTVPAGATHQPVSVTDLTSGLTGYSSKPFSLKFNGATPYNATFGTQVNFDGGAGLYDICLCDFDNDMKTDVIAANRTSTSVTLLRNTTATPGGTVSFARTTIPIFAPSLHVTCGDLNGDGKKDVVIIDDLSTKVIFFRNTSPGPGTITFAQTSISITNHTDNVMPEIVDLDRDGKPEVVISDQTPKGANGQFSILRNLSTTSALVFDTPLEIKVPGISSDDIVAADLNGDQLPEIITNQYQLATSNLYIFENQSTPGSLAFAAPQTLAIGGTVKRIHVSDLDGDDNPDIAVTQLTVASISIFRNTSSGGTISFASAVPVSTDFTPWGLDMADVDGDGKTDIVTASNTSKNLTLLQNSSTPGSLSFVRHSLATTFNNRGVRIGDMDGDSKPDIVFTDDGSAVTPAIPKISVLRNTHCVKPVITPEEATLSLCSSKLPFQLNATMSRGSSYQWIKDGSPHGSCTLNQNTLNITDAGVYQVKILQEGSSCGNESGCAQASEPITITTAAVAMPGDPTPTANGPSNDPVCAGSTLQLALTDVGGGAQYQWRGPNGFTAVGTSPTLPNFQPENSGRYYVDVVIGTCIARTESVVVESIEIPSFQISTTGADILCFNGDDKTLSVVPALGGFNYEWYKDGTLLVAGPTTYNVTAVPASSGSYKVRATYSGCTTVETPAKEIYVSTIVPTAAFNVSPGTTACANQEITFTNQSTFDNNLTPVYLWTFGDGNTSTETSPTHIYATDGSFNYSLQVSYKDNTCPSTLSGSISITPAPAVSITNPDNTFEICEGESLILQASGTFTDYVWSTGETTASIEVDKEGNYSLRVTSGSCQLTAYRTVTLKPAPLILVTASAVKINEGETTQLSASGVNSYLWEPAELVDNVSSASPVAGPLTQTTTFTVTGSDGGDCEGRATITIQVLGEAIVNKLKPGNFFSPDGQGTPESEFWQVENILDYPQCRVTIYDDKGVKVFDSKPYLNEWDGTFNGKKLPDGVYFYIIRCEGEESSPRSGSITILRR